MAREILGLETFAAVVGQTFRAGDAPASRAHCRPFVGVSADGWLDFALPKMKACKSKKVCEDPVQRG
jgi:hypothetical protein